MMHHPISLSLAVSAILFSGIAICFAGEEITSKTKFTETNFAEIRKTILLPSETRWSEIPWRPNLEKRLSKPERRTGRSCYG